MTPSTMANIDASIVTFDRTLSDNKLNRYAKMELMRMTCWIAHVWNKNRTKIFTAGVVGGGRVTGGK